MIIILLIIVQHRAFHSRDIVLIYKAYSMVKIMIYIAAVPWDANIESKYGEKVDHYKDLAIELDMSNCDL